MRPKSAQASLFPTSPPVLGPALKWAGGKRWQVPHLLPYWRAHAHNRLVEPFCGGLAVTFGLGPTRALLNDINPHLINFYRWLKKGFKTELTMENSESLYYSHRTRFNQLHSNGGADSEEAAGLFYYLNRTCFNGLCRFNRKGEFNTPVGRYAQINYTKDFTPYREVLQPWELMNKDFSCVPLDDNDFVYADPPYDVEFTQYARYGFTWHDQERTVEWLAQHKGPVVLSNQATERILRLYRSYGFTLTILDGPRRISCTGDRTPAKEVLATRNL